MYGYLLGWYREVVPSSLGDGWNFFIAEIKYDGIKYADNIEIPKNEGIGIDLRIKDLAVCSNIDKPYKNINKTQKIRKLKKKKRRLQRKISKKYLMNKKGDSYCKTSNIIKAEKRLLKLNHRLTDIRHNYLYQKS